MQLPNLRISLAILLTFAVSRAFGADAVVIKAPAGGDTVVVGSSALFNIEWKNSTNNNVTISLRQGPRENITLIHVIARSTYNNGSYAWRGNDDRFLAASSILAETHSGCNYTMEFRSGGEAINSDYFTILNSDDGGITQNMTCPSGSIAKGANTGSSNVGQSGGDDDASGVSTAALGGAVGGVAGGLILLFGLFFFGAKKSGMIIGRKDVERMIAERLQNEEGKRFLPRPEDQGISHAAGGPVYQMP